jgi:hypothetical protein
MKQIAKTTPGLQARRLAAVLALALAPVALHGRQVTPFTVSPDAQDPAPTATLTSDFAAGNFMRITTFEGTGAGAGNIGEVAETTLNSGNYLNTLGTFSFANDYPIISVNLGLSVHSILENINGDPLDSTARSSFHLHQFSLLFVGRTVGAAPAQFLLSQNSTLGAIGSADGNFHLILDGARAPSLDYTPTTESITGQIQSLEWLGASANNGADIWNPDGNAVDGGGNPVTDIPGDPTLFRDNWTDTFPVTADLPVTPGLTEIGFTLSSGGSPLDPASYLYAGGAGQTTWEVYLYTSGPSLGATPLQLNLSQIIIALEVPESSHALWGGLVLLGTAEILRRRKRAA